MKFFRIHLSTALCLMLVASVLLWLNTTNKSYLFNDSKEGWGEVGRYGWPWIMHFTYYPSEPIANSQRHIFWDAVLADCTVALATLIACGFLCEWRIRRRENIITSKS